MLVPRNSLSPQAISLLHEINNNQNNGDYWNAKYESLNYNEKIRLDSVFSELIDDGYIMATWADDYPFQINIFNKGYNVIENEKDIENIKQKTPDMIDIAPSALLLKKQPSLDIETEATFRELISKSNNAKSLNKAINIIERQTPKSERPTFNRRIDFLVRNKLISKKKRRSNVNGQVVQDYIYELTYEGERYFNSMATREKLVDTALEQKNETPSKKQEFDVFLSHANKDKLKYVDSLNKALKLLGIKIFYDKDELTWGDNWKQRVISGVRSAEFGIIVISKNFFGREWTENELYELLAQQNERGQKTILPILYKITIEELCGYYPALETIQCISAEKHSANEIAILFAKELIKRIRNT